MEKRKGLSKKVRFEVFKRDMFTCAYCGATPPKVVLECDHITPVSKGGKNVMDNLITACFDCNRGKSNNLLSSKSISIKEQHKMIIEKDLQFRAYQKSIRKYENALTKQENEVDLIYSEWFENSSLSNRFKKSSVRMFINKIGIIKVKEAMNKSCSKIEDEQSAIKYFCGICWSIIKEEDAQWEI